MSKTRVLVIEDDRSLTEVLTYNLKAAGYEVLCATDGQDGLLKAQTKLPDVVVLDLGLPDLDGTAMLRMLRGVSDVPVVVATARDDESEIVAVLDAGAGHPSLTGSHLVPSVRGDLLERAGRHTEAAAAFAEAADLTGNGGERTLLLGRAEHARSAR